MDKYFLDTEFIDTGSTIDLISIGIVCSDGREYYAQSLEFDYQRAETSEWLNTNVIQHLLVCESGSTIDRDFSRHNRDMSLQVRPDHCVWRTRPEIAREVKTFFNPPDGFELWGWCAGYDFVVLCQLFGTMMDLPQGWPHYIRDIQHVLDNQGISDDELPPQEDDVHNALADARHIKRLWEHLHVQEVRHQ